MEDDTCGIYGPQTIVILAMSMEYDHPIAANCDLVSLISNIS